MCLPLGISWGCSVAGVTHWWAGIPRGLWKYLHSGLVFMLAGGWEWSQSRHPRPLPMGPLHGQSFIPAWWPELECASEGAEAALPPVTMPREPDGTTSAAFCWPHATMQARSDSQERTRPPPHNGRRVRVCRCVLKLIRGRQDADSDSLVLASPWWAVSPLSLSHVTAWGTCS